MRDKNLLQFPCIFPVIAMGGNKDTLFRQHVEEIIGRVSSFNREDIHEKSSRTGKYLSVTVEVFVENRENLENIYQALKSSKRILMTL